METYCTTCDTVYCVAGWMMHFSGGDVRPEFEDLADSLAWTIITKLGYKVGRLLRTQAFHVLFGGDRDRYHLSQTETISMLRKAAQWFIHRILAEQNYERLRAMPRKERRRLQLAA